MATSNRGSRRCRQLVIQPAVHLAHPRARSHRVDRMYSHRFYAVLTLILLGVGVGWLALNVSDAFPLGFIAAAMICGGMFCAWEGGSPSRHCANQLAHRVRRAVHSGGADSVSNNLVLRFDLRSRLHWAGILVGEASIPAEGDASRCTSPEHPVVFWNPKSGGGKAAAVNLPQAASVRGIRPIQLSPGDDLEQLVRAAIAEGADALAAAGGDGTQAVVASLAAEHDLPFACIPAGTRNHFAL